MVGGEILYITLMMGMPGHISQINPQRIPTYIFHTIEASYICLYCPDDALIVQNIYTEILRLFVRRDQTFPL